MRVGDGASGGLAVATAARVRGRDATPDDRRGCKTSDRDCEASARSGRHSPAAGRKKRAIGGWALALARRLRRGAGGLRWGGERILGGGPAMFGTARTIPAGLSLPFLPAMGSLPIVPTGAAASPSPSRGPALATAIARLGMGGMKRLLASLEKTPSLPRPTSPLTGRRFAASWCWAQGGCELPTAKPRMRSPYLRSEAPSPINSAPVRVRHAPA
jgi:hypothetical protein